MLGFCEGRKAICASIPIEELNRYFLGDVRGTGRERHQAIHKRLKPHSEKPIDILCMEALGTSEVAWEILMAQRRLKRRTLNERKKIERWSRESRKR